MSSLLIPSFIHERLFPKASGISISRPPLQEMIDDPAMPLAVREELFEALDKSNQVYGIYTRFIRYFEHWFFANNFHLLPRPLKLLEIGSGAGDLVQQLTVWAARHNLNLEFHMMDMDPEVLSWAKGRLQARGINVTTYASGDRHVGQFWENQFDIIYSLHVIHHIAEADLERAFADCGRVARHGIFMFDFHRRPLDMLGLRLGGMLYRMDPRIIQDGVISLKRVLPQAQILATCRKVLPPSLWRIEFDRLPIYPYVAMKMRRI